MRRLLVSIAVGFALSGCGGGGEGNPTTSNALPAIVATATPTPTPTLAPVANTSVQSYLPFRSGNTWKFSSGSRIMDHGQIGVALTNGASTTAEQFDFIAPDGTLSGSMFFDKGNWPLAGPYANDRITYLAGATSGSATYPTNLLIPGIPVIDNTPQAGETLLLTSGGTVTATTIIGSVNGTQAMGSQTINHVAQTTLSGSGYQFSFGLAQGVGFTSVTQGTQTVNVVSFTVSNLSTSERHRSLEFLPASSVSSDPANITALLSHLF